MTENTRYSLSVEDLSSNPNLNITIETDSQNSEQAPEVEGNDVEIDSIEIEDDGEQNPMLKDGEQVLEMSNGEQLLEILEDDRENERDVACIIGAQNGSFERTDYPPPAVGMVFDSYEDAYNYYNCYAKELGFAIRVKSSWTKRNSKEKRGAVLCCNCEGFKTIKEASSRRKETRTGCLAMIRLRLVESNQWRVDEVKLEHNHSFDPVRAKNSKSHKKMDSGSKRRLEPNLDVEVCTIKLYKAPVLDRETNGSSTCEDRGSGSDHVNHLKLTKEDVRALHDFFCQIQLSNPNFLYLMDLSDEGHLRNAFWIDSGSRAAYSYFNDVIALDTVYLSEKYEIPLVAFVGVNHHAQPILLGCGLILEETVETYIWLFRAWLTCMWGRSPQTILTDQSNVMQIAIAEVFPRAHCHLLLSRVMQSILENVGNVQDSEAFLASLDGIINDSLKIEEFEMAWENTVQEYGLGHHELLQALYEARERWAPVYLKDTCFAGMNVFRGGNSISPFFDGYIHKKTSLKVFLDMYESIMHSKRCKEMVLDLEPKDPSPSIKTGYYYELQLSEVYTKTIFSKFQDEVVMVSSCFSVTQIHANANAPSTTYLVKERDDHGNVRNVEVTFDSSGMEVRCICNCFNFWGYLCRHALCILNYNGVEEIPSHYILSRWRKDFKRLYIPDFGSNNVDITNPVQWFEHLYRKAMQVVEEGMQSQDHYMVAWQSFKESLNKVRLVTDKNVQQ